MAAPRIGGLFEGYGGLTAAILEVLGGELAWYSENDPAASKVLAHHNPGVTNLGDITTIDWETVPPIDILTGGWPCQDISNAGKQAGIEGARSGLWRNLATAARVLRPRLIVLENVSAVVVRGLDRVLADLAEIGFDAEWTCIRASDVGAPHRRERFFAIAVPWGGAGGGPPPPRPPDGTKGGPNQRGSSGDLMLPSAVQNLLPTPTASDRFGPGAHGEGGADLRTTVSLLPTPRASDTGTPGRRASEGFRPPLSQVVNEKLLPTPQARDGGNHGASDPVRRKELNPKRSPMLDEAVVYLLPTPAASRSGNNQSPSPNAAVRPSLDSITHLLPTSTTATTADVEPGTTTKAASALAPAEATAPARNGDGLTVAGTATRTTCRPREGSDFALLPTPTVHGNNNAKGISETSQDGLTTVLKRLTGDSSSPQSIGGKACSEDVLPSPPSQESGATES